MKSSGQPGFWRTLPGVLTALAGVITAVAGLMLAFDQIRSRSARAPEDEQSSTASQSPGPSSPSPASPPSAIRAATTALIVGPPNEVSFKQGGLVFRVLTARLEPFNQDTRLLSVSLRFSNNMKSLDRSYYSELRALADDVPQAPMDQIEAHSVKDIAYTFRLPAGTRTLALRITRDEEAGDIPLHLK